MYRNEIMRAFTGPFAQVFEAYIHQNRVAGYVYRINETYLRQFDRFCIGKVEPGSPITKELFEEWTSKRPYEAEATHHMRHDVLVQFCQDAHGVDHGLCPGFYPQRMPTANRGFAPHIFTEDEMQRFFVAVDQKKPSSQSPYLHIILPVLFRLLYSSGLRFSEALNLRHADVDLEQGCIAIRNSKFDKSAKLPLCASMTEVCKRYVERMQGVFDETEYFFPAPDAGVYAQCSIYAWYRRCLFQAGIPHGGRGRGPRLHDLRHTFAVHSLQKMVRENVDLYVSLPFLSGYMRHKTLAATQLYLRLTPDAYQGLTFNFEKAFGHVFPEVLP